MYLSRPVGMRHPRGTSRKAGKAARLKDESCATSAAVDCQLWTVNFFHYRKSSTSIRSLPPWSTCEYRIHRRSGEYESDPRKWLKLDWIDQYGGKRYRITTEGYHGTRQSARVKTYGEILREYEFHPESKYAGADGKPSGKQTVGLLQRRHIRIGQIKYIGKESNSLEDVGSGLIHSAENVYTEYPDPRRDEWETKIRPALKRVPLSRLVKMSGKSRRMLIDARTGRRRPYPKSQELLAEIVRKISLI